MFTTKTTISALFATLSASKISSLHGIKHILALLFRKEAWTTPGAEVCDQPADWRKEFTTLSVSASWDNGITATTLGGPWTVPVGQ